MTEPRTATAIGGGKRLLLWVLGGSGYPLGQEWEKYTLTLGPYTAVGVILGANAAIALWLGLQDLFSPVSLSAQIVGFFYTAAGALSLYGVFNTFLFYRRVQSGSIQEWAEQCDAHVAISYLRNTSARPLKFMALAALAGLYIDLTLLFYSFHYRPVIAAFSLVLAIFCACLTRVTMPVLWNDLGRGLKATGLTLAALGAIAQFWYQSVYVPGNTPIGMHHTVTLGSVIRSDGVRYAQVNLATEDAGSVPAVDLASMVIVRGVIPGQERMPALDVAVLTTPASFFFPSNTLSNAFLVKITNPKIKALRVIIFVYFARTTWLTLANRAVGFEKCYNTTTYKLEKSCGSQPVLSCPQSMQYQWTAAESSLHNFTQGNWTIYSDWLCTHWRLSIDAYTIPNHNAPGSDLDILRSTRYDTLVLPRTK